MLGSIPGVALGAVLRVEVLSGRRALLLIVAAVLLPLGISLLRNRTIGSGGQGRDAARPALWVSPLAGVVGIVGGLYGIGGRSLLSPMPARAGYSLRAVAPAALVATFVTSIVGIAVFQLLAAIHAGESIAPDWTLGLALGVGGLLGGYLGASLSNRLPERALRIILGCASIAIAAKWTIIVRATPLTLLPAFAERAHSKTFIDGLIERTEALWPNRETVHAAKLSTPHQFGCVVTREMKSKELRSGNWCRVAVVVDAGGIVGIHVRDPLDPDDAGGWSVATPGLATERLEPLLGFVAECPVDLDAIGRCRADVHIRGLNDHQVASEAGHGQFKNDGGQHFSGELVVPAEADDLAELAADWRRQLERNAGIASWH